MNWFEERVRRRRRPRGGRRARQGRQKSSCADRLECGCEGCGAFDCLTLVSLTMVLRAFLGAFRASAVDPHTPRPGTVGARVASRCVRSYQLHVSSRRSRPVCHLSPSCSRYGLQALSSYGVVRGGLRIARRLRECRAAGRECAGH